MKYGDVHSSGGDKDWTAIISFIALKFILHILEHVNTLFLVSNLAKLPHQSVTTGIH